MDEIMKKYANDVKRFCMSLCHDEQMAEELTQETFFRALRTIHHYDGSCLMSTWLFQIAKRAWVDALRKKKSGPVDWIENRTLCIEHETPETIFYRKERMRSLLEMIDELKEPEHTVFVMRAVLEKSYKEIGVQFSKTENWARVTYYRARMKLMERVIQDEDAL